METNPGVRQAGQPQNTKKLTGTLAVHDKALLHNGCQTDCLPIPAEAVGVAKAITAATGVAVQTRPRIVLAGGDLDVRGRPGNLASMDRLELRRCLNKQPRGVLAAAVVLRLERAARTPSTWPSSR